MSRNYCCSLALGIQQQYGSLLLLVLLTLHLSGGARGIQVAAAFTTPRTLIPTRLTFVCRRHQHPLDAERLLPLTKATVSDTNNDDDKKNNINNRNNNKNNGNGSKSQPLAIAGSIDARRKVLFGRQGPHFFLDRTASRIEFGDKVPLLSREFDSEEILEAWIGDADEFGAALWRSDKLTRLGFGVYRMGLLPLEFVMLKFEPWVQVQCLSVQDSQSRAVFTLQSTGCEPNPTHITFVPGMPSTLTLDDVVKNLQIKVEVAGQVRRVDRQAKGTMVYQVTCTLPAALLLLPDPLLKAAAETINKEVVKFAKLAFQRGTRERFPIFLQRYEQQKQQAELQ